MAEQIVDEISYRFKVSGNLIKNLGEDSIANKNVAILELIKNAYDAKASKVAVVFEGVNTSHTKIIISDNGDGMSDTDLNTKWLNIATSNKRKALKPTDRIPVGEKGIGRLSSQSLGEETMLLTKPKGESFAYKIIFDWPKYMNSDVLVNEVVNKGYKIKKVKSESGTTLEVSNLKHNWNDLDAQKKLLKDIYLIHPPNAKPKGFSITPPFPKVGLKKIDKKFLSNAHYSVKVALTSGNVLKYECKAITGKTKKGQIKLEKKLTCGDASFEFYYYYRAASAYKKALNSDISPEKIKENNELLDEYSGIKIYRDLFRVKPFGEEGNDWLGLDASFQNATMFPRNSNSFGFINISKIKNPAITDTTTREGILFTQEFQDLMTFTYTSIKEVFVEFRKEIEPHKKKAGTVTNKSLSLSKKKVPAVSPATKPSVSTEKLISIGTTYPQTFYATLEQEINDCYKSNYPNAAFFLSRKLIENLIYNILEKKFKSEIDVYYDTATNTHHKLSLLIKNLFSRKKDFKASSHQYIDQFNTDVGTFRKEANNKAHNIYDYLSDKSELKKFKIENLVQLLLNIYNGI